MKYTLVIADKQDQKKIDKKEIEYQKLIDLTPINIDKVNHKYINNPEKILIEEKVDKNHQKSVEELIKLLKNDLPEITLLNKLKFNLLSIEYYRFKRIFEDSPVSKPVMMYIKDIENCRSNPTNKKIEGIYVKYRKHLDHKFGDIDSWEFIKNLKEGKSLIEPLIKKFRAKVEHNENYFIRSVDYNLLESKYVFYYILDFYRYDIQPVFQEVFKELIIELNSLHHDSLDKLDLNKIDKYKKMFQEQKNALVPLSITDKLGVEQNDLLKLQAKELELFSLISFDILFEDIKDAFYFREYSRIGFASVLYDFFCVTHSIHPVYEFYTEKEWWDEQDKKGNIPTNRKWKNHKLLRVKNIIPNF